MLLLKPISRRMLFLMLVDIAAVIVAYILAFSIRYGVGIYRLTEIPFFYLSLFVFPISLYIFDLYYPFKYFAPAQTFIDVILSVSIGGILLATASYFDHTFILPSRVIFVYITLVLGPLIFCTRLLYDFIFKSRFLDKKTLILGTGPLASEIARAVTETPHSNIEIVGFVSENNKSIANSKNGIRVLGDLSNLISLIDWYGIQLVILALDPKRESSETDLMSQLFGLGVLVTSAIHLFERLTGKLPYEVLDNHYLLGLMAQIKTRPYLKLKRFADMIFGILLLIAVSPIFLAAALLWFTGSKEIFFIQQRIGRDGAPFRLIKLRTMTENKHRKQTVTRFGKWIRRYRIDEIPQLINVIKGDMSLIGPRPEIPYFVARSRKRIPFYDTVFAVKPGLTGWAQVKFRYATSIKDYNEKFRYNLFYLKNISLALDLMILLKTIRVILLGRGK